MKAEYEPIDFGTLKYMQIRLEQESREQMMFLKFLLAMALFGLFLVVVWSITERNLAACEAGLNRMENTLREINADLCGSTKEIRTEDSL